MKKKVVEKESQSKKKRWENTTEGENEWQRERERTQHRERTSGKEGEECVERQTVGFVSTEQFFSPVNRLISSIGGDHWKKNRKWASK